MNRNTIIISAGIAIILIAVYFFYFRGPDASESSVIVPVKKGVFEVKVTTTGELLAKNSEDINGPTNMRSAGVYQVKIEDLVPEGTEVDSGAYIATLDRTEVTGKLKDIHNELQKAESQYIQTKLDTTLDLRAARDELINLQYAMEERDLELKNSKYEPPSTIRQAEISLDKSKRSYTQALENYKIKKAQSIAKMQETEAVLNKQKNNKQKVQDLLKEFVIKAPKPGMVIYVKEWSGKKRQVGSTISPWNPAVATLPDLSEMTSKTFVNEIDIGKIKPGQKVTIGVDALSEFSYKGEVTQVANIGEQRPNTTAKVFEVTVKLFDPDSVLRPSMTTSNEILVATVKDALSIPLECLHSNDSVTYVFKEKGLTTVRQVVNVGLTNDNEAIIKAGLIEGDNIYLSVPEKGENLKLVALPEEAATAMKEK